MTGVGGSQGQRNASRLTGRLRTPARVVAAIRNVLGNPQEWIGVVLVFVSLAVAVENAATLVRLDRHRSGHAHAEPHLLLIAKIEIMAV